MTSDSIHKENQVKKYYYIIFCIIIFCVAIQHICEVYQPTLMDDEFAYWGIAKYFDGVDWSPTMSLSRYYSYGYSFILYLILQVFSNPIYMYRAAVAVNGIFLCGVFLVQDSIYRKMFPDTGRLLLCVVSFLMTLMPCNIAYANVSLSENLLLLLLCVIVRLFCDMDSKAPYWKCFLLGILLTYSYMVHQRMLGVMVAAALVLFFMMLLKKVGLWQFLSVMCSMAVMMVLHTFIKADLKEALWMNSAASSVNDYGSLTSHVVNVFSSLKGLLIYGVSISGKLFYFASVTYMIGIIGLVIIIKRSFCAVKNSETAEYASLFILTSFIMLTGVATMFFYNPATLASLLYGRYMEIIYPLVTGIGIIVLYDLGMSCYKKVIFLFGGIGLVYGITGIALKLFVKHRNLTWLNYISCSQMYKYMSGDNLPFIKTMAVVLMTSAAVMVYFGLRKYKKAADVAVSIAFLILAWNTSDFALQAVNLPLQQSKYDTHSIVDYMQENDIEGHEVFYYIDEEESVDTSVYREYMQYWLQDKQVLCIDSEQLESIPESSWLIVSNEEKETIGKEAGMKKVYENEVCVMWGK